MCTKGISARAARDLARGLGVPCFTLHDFDKNGFVMAGGFSEIATDIGIRMRDIEEWELEPEPQLHGNSERTRGNLRYNGATDEEAKFIASGQRVELNMFTGPDFIEFVEGKLEQHGVEKIIPDDDTLAAAWTRAHQAIRVNGFIRRTRDDTETPAPDLNADAPSMPADLADRIRKGFDEDDTQSWDEVLWDLAKAAA